MLSALVAEKLIWGTSPGAWSLAGSALILGAAAMVAVSAISPCRGALADQ